MSLRVWDAASRSPVQVAGARRPELVALPTELPTLAQLFTFVRDAELRFETLRLAIDERTFGTRGEQHVLIDVMIRHPGEAKVTTSDPSRGTRGNYEIWISDGVTVRTYSGISKVGTERPVRRGVRGLDDPDLPGTSTVYRPLTPLPMESLPEMFVHPAGLCQSVLATGDCRIVGTADHNGREVIIVECHHPRTVEVTEDRPDHQLQVWFDRETGIVARLVETIARRVTRDAVATSLGPNAALPPTAFTFTFPSDARMLF
jgi:outer membrane lipoprotein-sorting protein